MLEKKLEAELVEIPFGKSSGMFRAPLKIYRREFLQF
jgi:hypothetical protein